MADLPDTRGWGRRMRRLERRRDYLLERAADTTRTEIARGHDTAEAKAIESALVAMRFVFDVQRERGTYHETAAGGVRA